MNQYGHTVGVLRGRALGGRARLDSGAVLKRFHFLERAVVRTCAAWIPSVHSIDAKAVLARIAWQSSLTGNASLERVFELRYPSRLAERGDDEPLIALYEASVDAPSSVAMLKVVGEVLLPHLERAQRAYLDAADALADGPSRRFLELSIEEKRAQVEALRRLVEEESLAGDAAAGAGADGWVRSIATALEQMDASGPAASDGNGPPAIAGSRPYAIPRDPRRDGRYFACSFYWPDTVDPSYPYGDGVQLQVRSAVSHLNEVWAVEIAGAALFELIDELGWDFAVDAARWTYDESRHMLMGKRRLDGWGIEPSVVPLGRYIFDAAMLEDDPIHRIGMLGFFETKNIGKKMTRARTFAEMGDDQSERDMEFDWADETIHAEYGRRWLKQLLEHRGLAAEQYADVLTQCQGLVARRVALATDPEKLALRACADRLLATAERIATAT